MKWHFEQQPRSGTSRSTPTSPAPSQPTSPPVTTPSAAVKSPAPPTGAPASSASPAHRSTSLPERPPLKRVSSTRTAVDHVRAPRTFAESTSPAGVLVQLTDLGLAAAILVVPFVMGGRQAIGHVVLCGLACLVTVAWSLHQFLSSRSEYRLLGMELPLLAGAGLVGLQIVSLPAEWITQLSPKLQELIPLWHSPVREALGLPEWTTLSLTPSETRGSFIVLLACVMLFLIACQRVRGVEDVRRLLTCCAWSTLLMAAFGIAQLFWGNGNFFWFYAHPTTNTLYAAKGGFTNANHFASFLAMGIPLWLWILSRGADSGRSTAADGARRESSSWGADTTTPLSGGSLRMMGGICAVTLLVLGILLSQSRGGVLVGFGGGLASLVLLWRQRQLAGPLAFCLSSLAILALGSLIFLGDEITRAIEGNFHELASGDLDQLDSGEARRRIWEAARIGTTQFPLVGTGLNSHAEVYWTFYDHPQNGTEASHAESGYFQIALETGLIGLGIVGLILLWLGGWVGLGLLRHWGTAEGALVVTLAVVLAINLVHSVTDFIWYAPGCMIVVLMCAACLSRVAARRLATPQESGPPGMGASLLRLPVRFGWGLMLLAGLGFGGWSMPIKLAETKAEQHWFTFLKIEQVDLPLDDAAGREAQLRAETRALLSAVQADPSHHRAQYRLAQRCLALFHTEQLSSESPLPLAHFRDASRGMTTTDREEWLRRPAVIGPRRKYLDAAWRCALRSLRECPLQSRIYLQLLDLAWLHDVDGDFEPALLAQAEAARPYDAAVQIRLGQLAWSEQRLEDGLAHFQEAFRRDLRYRRPMIEAMYHQFPAAFFLDHFDLDAELLIVLKSLYRESPDRRGYERVTEALARAALESADQSRGDEAIHWLLRAFSNFQELGWESEADQALRTAYTRHPHFELTRRALGDWEFAHQRYAEAAEHLLWVLRLNPSDSALRAKAEEATRMASREVAPLVTPASNTWP